MIQDIYPRKFNNHYDGNIVPSGEDTVLAFKGADMIMDPERQGFPKVSDFAGLDRGKLIYLFSIDEERFFLLQDEDVAVPEGFSYDRFKILREQNSYSKADVFAAFTAYQLNEWYSVTRFCGRCGAPNENDKDERARICPKCGNKIYPRINPAVIIGICDPKTDRIVLTRYRTGFGHNALVAGFTEIGETLEETVARESMEEVGLKVKNVRYYKSQPWGIASDILAGFFCDVDGDSTIQMDSSELKYAEWVSCDEIELQPTNYSLTNEMMGLFKEKGYEGTT